MPRVERIIGVVVEINVGIGAGKSCLVFPAPLCVKTHFERMWTNNFRDIVDEVEGVILIDKRQPIEIYIRKALIGDPAETDVRHITETDFWEELRDIEIYAACQSVVIAGSQINKIAARPEDKFIGQCRAESVR